MLARSVPADGDIVVCQQKREGTLVYVLHTAPGPEQYLLPTREEAVAQAMTFAKRARVRAWVGIGESSFALLGESQGPRSNEDSLLSTVVQPHDALSQDASMRPVHEVVARLRAEYLEMPGLRLKAEQVQRLCGIRPLVCQSVLDALVDARFLCATSDGHYARVTDGEIHRPYPAKADIGRAGQPSLKAS